MHRPCDSASPAFPDARGVCWGDDRPTRRPLRGALRLDGTLVDSTLLHVDARDRALVSAGRPVDVWRIHRGIGMDSALLLDDLLGEDADEYRDAAKAEHDRLYLDMADRLRPIVGGGR